MYEGEDTHDQRDPNSFWTLFLFGLCIPFALVWAMPWIVFGIVCCVTIIGIPVGVLSILIGCAPFIWLQNWRIKSHIGWEFRDRAYGEEFDEEVPWNV